MALLVTACLKVESLCGPATLTGLLILRPEQCEQGPRASARARERDGDREMETERWRERGTERGGARERGRES